MASRLNIVVFGLLEVSTITDSVEVPEKMQLIRNSLGMKAQALFCFLLITRRVYTRDQLSSLFWGECPEHKAKNSLRVALTSIRQLHKGCITSDRQRLSFNVDALGHLDVQLFDEMVGTLSSEDDESTMRDIEHIIRLYRGELLAEIFVRDASIFQTWLESERSQRHQKVMQLFARQVEFFLKNRLYEDARNSLQRQLQIEPWNETAHQQMMKTLSHLGDFNGAIQQYKICCQRLKDEISVKPMPETNKLFERIMAARTGIRHNLSARMVKFVGRPEEKNTLHRLLVSPQHRLITVMGLGGIGKTSLALHVAKELYNDHTITFLNGIFFIELISVRTLEHLVSKIADTLNINPSHNQDGLTQIIDALKNKELLLVLDDWDSLLYSLKKFGSGNELESTTLVRTLLEKCPNITILLTSRNPLFLRFEKRVTLRGLTIPPDNASSLDGYSAAEFFLQIANQAYAEFTVTDENRPHIIQICKMLDGMPLGIELAAAWVHAISCEQIAVEIQNLDFLSAEMQDLPERQRNLRSVFDYSWQLMSEQEHDVFMRLSIFSDGFTEEAARQISDLTPQILRSLINRSLIKHANPDIILDKLSNTAKGDYFDLVSAPLHDEPLQKIIELPKRYSLHNVVRQYAAEKLAENKKLQYSTRQKHSRYYAEFMQMAKEKFYTEDHKLSLALIKHEKQNVLSAWSWALNYLQLSHLDKIIDVIEEYFILTEEFREAELSAKLSAEYLSGVLINTTTPDPQAQIMLGRILAYRARFLAEIYEYDSMLVVSQELMKLAEETATIELKIIALYLSGVANQNLGKIEKATDELDKSLRLAKNNSLPMLIAKNLRNIGIIALWNADYEETQKLFAAELELRRRLNDRRGEMFALNNLGVLLHQKADYLTAHSHYSDALALFAQIKDLSSYGHILNNLGRVYSEQRNFAKAMEYIQQAIQIKRDLNNKKGESNALLSLGRNYMLVGQYASAQELHIEALCIKRSIGDWRGEAESLTYLALIHYISGKHQEALEYMVLANSILEQTTARFIKAQLLTIHSHILFSLKQFSEAKDAAIEALAEWQARKNDNLSMEPLANLARIEFEFGNEKEAIEYINQIIAYLKTGNLDGVNFPLNIYLICYTILNKIEDQRSAALIKQANDKLTLWSAAIDNDEMRNSYLSITHHRRIRELSDSA